MLLLRYPYTRKVWIGEALEPFLAPVAGSNYFEGTTSSIHLR